MKKQDLFAFLDAYSFVEEWEIEMAIEEFFRRFVEKDEEFTPSYWELAYYSELASEYINKKQIFLPF